MESSQLNGERHLAPSFKYFGPKKYELRKRLWRQPLSNRADWAFPDALKVQAARDALETGAGHWGARMLWQKLTLYLSTAWLFCFLIGVSLLLSILRFISPSLTKKIILKMGENTTMTQNPKFKYEDWGLTFTSLQFLKSASHNLWLGLGKEAFLGGRAPDSPVVNMEGQKTSISAFMKGVWPDFKLGFL